MSDFARLSGEVFLHLGEGELAGRDQLFIAHNAVRWGLRTGTKSSKPHVGDLFSEVLHESSRQLTNRSKRKKHPFVGLVEYLRHCRIDGRQPDEDPLVSCDLAHRSATAKITGGQQKEQDGEPAEHHLKGPIQLERADEHISGEYAPEDEEPGKGRLARGGSRTGTIEDRWEEPDAGQGEPEETVRGEGQRTEGVVLPPLHDPGDDLGHTAIEDAHGEDHGVELEEAGVMEVEEDGGETEAHEPQGRRVRIGVQ